MHTSTRFNQDCAHLIDCIPSLVYPNCECYPEVWEDPMKCQSLTASGGNHSACFFNVKRQEFSVWDRLGMKIIPLLDW